VSSESTDERERSSYSSGCNRRDDMAKVAGWMGALSAHSQDSVYLYDIPGDWMVNWVDDAIIYRLMCQRDEPLMLSRL